MRIFCLSSSVPQCLHHSHLSLYISLLSLAVTHSQHTRHIFCLHLRLPFPSLFHSTLLATAWYLFHTCWRQP